MFEFLKEAGEKLFGGGNDEAEAIKKSIDDRLGTQIKDLEVSFDNGQVKISGEVPSQEVRTKAILAAGNVEGVFGVDAAGVKINPPPGAQVAAAAAPAGGGAKETFYDIQRGDSLSAIAKRYYGDASKWPKIFEANREIIKDPDLIYPGQKIVIPDA
ncbi:MAG: peptidoglycan-binding protein LysM [Gammaproteobacteria bacterium]